MKVRERVWPWFFWWSKEVQAITLYPYIIYRSEAARNKCQGHEFKHVEQVRRLGWVKFYASYLNESRKKGYMGNKYEQEANDNERMG